MRPREIHSSHVKWGLELAREAEKDQFSSCLTLRGGRGCVLAMPRAELTPAAAGSGLMRQAGMSCGGIDTKRERDKILRNATRGPKNK